MPVAFPSKDYGPEEILHLLDQFENSLVEKTFSSIQTYSSAIDEFVRKNVIPDLEPFFRTIAQNIQLFYDESDGSIIGIRESIRGVIEQLEHVSEKIEDIFRPFLQEGSFLVHGDSELLASVLEDCLCSNPNVDILILEGLPRGSGIDLLKRMKESPVVKNNPDYMKRLLLAPDSSALRLLQRRKCNFVLFGAHAVTPHGCLVNSAGSLQLATLAKESNVAVYSLCPTFKFYLSMQRMPLSSDDLDVLGNALPGAITTKGGVPSTSSQCSSPTHRSSRIEGDSPIHGDVSMNSGGGMGRPQMSRNSPSIQAQQQQQSTISNASFSGPPPTIQISPQLKPTPPGSSLPQNNNNINTGKPQLPPFGMSSSLSNTNNNNNNSNSATPTEEVQGGNKSLNNNASVTLPSAINTVSSSGAGSSYPPQTTCGTTSVPKISPVLGATASPMMNSLIDGMHNNNNQNQQRRNSASTPSQLAVTTPTFGSQHLTATDSNNNTTNNNERDSSQPNMMSHFAPTCAFQLDLIGADKITHFFTEHGVVMPWSVADKISKIFLKEIQNKRKVNRGASAAHTAGGL